MIERLRNSSAHHVALFSFAAILVLLPTTLGAQEGQKAGNQFELTPSIGYQFGGEYAFVDGSFGFTEFNVESSESWGLTFGIPIGRSFQIELMYLNQDTEIEIKKGIGQLLDNQAEFEFYHVGFVWQNNLGQVRPFLVASAGVTRIEPGLTQFDAQTEPSASIVTLPSAC